MATTTLGTNATTSLTSLIVKPGYGSGMSAADIATISNLIRDDQGNVRKYVPGAFSANNQLVIPNRGVLKILPGDYVGVDATTGWPVLISALAIASGPWTHS